ncbi:MAG TPA: cyanophycin synthetase, partial [Acidimicrobiia bacterium]|nr:cyanophycin synthetase [Acidimicrobiia bacterium]
VSSYQASEVEVGPDHAVLTALFPEHLDWHGSVERYYADKLRLLRAAGVHTISVNAADANAMAHTDGMERRPYGVGPGIHARDGGLFDGGRRLVATGPHLRGAHTLTNAAGALAVASAFDASVLHQPELLAEWMASFEPLPHRLQPIGEHDGVEYIDDSIATSPSATAAALDAFAARPVTLLVGGHDRSLPLDPLLDALARRGAPTLVCAMPTTGEHVADAIEARELRDVAVVRCDSLADAVRHAVAHTAIGAVVLLSPAAASYDRFTSYAHRGAEFQRLVREHADR